jgi:hypothetical protein
MVALFVEKGFQPTPLLRVAAQASNGSSNRNVEKTVLRLFHGHCVPTTADHAHFEAFAACFVARADRNSAGTAEFVRAFPAPKIV